MTTGQAVESQAASEAPKRVAKRATKATRAARATRAPEKTQLLSTWDSVINGLRKLGGERKRSLSFLAIGVPLRRLIDRIEECADSGAHDVWWTLKSAKGKPGQVHPNIWVMNFDNDGDRTVFFDQYFSVVTCSLEKKPAFDVVRVLHDRSEVVIIDGSAAHSSRIVCALADLWNEPEGLSSKYYLSCRDDEDLVPIFENRSSSVNQQIYDVVMKALKRSRDEGVHFLSCLRLGGYGSSIGSHITQNNGKGGSAEHKLMAEALARSLESVEDLKAS